MLITNLSIVEYIQTCIKTAYDQGYLWVMVLLARERDATRSYEELKRYWDSFNDLTGKSILFILSMPNTITCNFGSNYGMYNSSFSR